MYKQNPSYQEALERDPLYGCSLFKPEQFGLDPLPRIINDAEETKAKALQILEKYLEQQQFDVLMGYKRLGPCTDWDVSRLLGIERSSVCGRRNTLVKYGLIVKFDEVQVERGKRLVPNARWQVVIKIPEKLINKKLKD